MAQQQIYTIDTFKGVNKSDTETLLEIGEASSMKNFLISDDMKLKKQYGYSALNTAVASEKINGMWYGELNGTAHFLFARTTKVYEHNLSTDVDTELGTITEHFPTTFFAANNTVYILDGTGYFQWDGTTFAAVTGYVPTVFTATPPTGGGTILETVNNLSGSKIQKFSGDNAATVYQLSEYDIDSVDSVTVGGVTMATPADYSVDLDAGTVTFAVHPGTGVNNVVIQWTKVSATQANLIKNCVHYGGSFYSRYWLFGNPNHKNTRYPSGVTMAGVSDPTYFPYGNDSDVGEYEITDILTHQDNQLIFTTGDSSGASAWYSTVESYLDDSADIVVTLFPVYPLNAKVGNVAPGQVRIILNNPFTIWKGIYEWVSTNVMNEKNAVWKSKRIQNDLDALDLISAVTWDWDDKGLYLISVGKVIWVYNYRIDAWYILELPDTPTCFMTIDKELYFGTSNGQIMKFSTSVYDYNGTAIDATWEMGFANFGVDWIRKFIRKVFISLNPMTRSSVKITYETDKSSTSSTYTASYGLTQFDNWDFSDFSFKTNYSPQPFRFKIRAKKIDYFKLCLQNDGSDSVTVLSITLPARLSGEVRQ